MEAATTRELLTSPLAKSDRDDSDDAMQHEQLSEAMNDSVTDLGLVNDVTTPPDRKGSSGADLILPIIIYAVVKSNPPQLASHLMYLRRFRSAICLTGETSYAIVNLTAVIDFIEHVQLSRTWTRRRFRQNDR